MDVLFQGGTVAGLDDVGLLERFRTNRDEIAFAALVERHGPMVLAACRGFLGDASMADDVFQATFLVLARRAGAIRRPERLGPWLHGVACYTAARAMRRELRRMNREREAVLSKGSRERTAATTLDRETVEVLHREIDRLPERYRIPVILCDLQGLSRPEVARRLRWPLGTVNGRLSRARELLRRRLVRRGILSSAGALTFGMTPMTVREALARETTRAAVGATLGLTSAAVAVPGGRLARDVSRAMVVSRTMTLALGLGALSLGLLGPGMLLLRGMETRQAAEVEARAATPRSPLDALRPDDIPRDVRLPGQPENLVAVLGEHRGRHGGQVRCLAISPDGNSFATAATQDKDIKIWDARTLELKTRLVGHRSAVNCLAISPDGKTIASGSTYGDFLLWDLRGPTPGGPTQLATRGTSGFNHTIHATAFSPDGKTLAVSGSAKGLGLYDLTGTSPRERVIVSGLGKEVRALAFAPDDGLIAMAMDGDRNGEGSVQVWETSGDRPRARWVLRSGKGQEIPGTSVRSLAFAPDGKTLAVVGFFPQGLVHLWDLSRDPPSEKGSLPIGLGGITLLQGQLAAFSLDGKTLAAGQSDGSIRFWDMTARGPVERATIPGHKGPVDVLEFTHDGRTLVSGGDDHMVRTWDATAAVPKARFSPRGPVGGLKGLAFAPDGKTLAVGGDDRVIRLWDLAEKRAGGQGLSPRSEIAARGPIQVIAFSPDGTMLSSGDELWTLKSGMPPVLMSLGKDTRFFAFQADVPGSVEPRAVPMGRDPWSVAFTPDGKNVISGRYGQTVNIWGVGGSKPPLELKLGAAFPEGRGFPAAVDQPSHVAVSPDGKILAVSAAQKSVALLDLSADPPREYARLEGTGWPISSLAFAPDGKTLAAGTNGGTPIWDLTRPQPRLLRTIKDCLGFSLAFTRGSTQLIAADEVFGSGKPLEPSHPAVCVYEVASGRRLHEWHLSAPCWAIALAPDGRHLAAAKQDGTVDILRLAALR